MILKHLRISNFKNIAEAELDLSAKVNGFLGNNGMGKSNLLDAIHYLTFCKSFSGMTDQMLIRKGEEWALLQASYLRRGVDEELSLGMARGRRKQLKRMGKEYDRLSNHIGAFPLVISSPADIDLVRGPGEERRRLIDMLISQADAVYLDRLIRYNQALEQRNRMLRDRSSIPDPTLFMAIEMQMDAAAAYIIDARSRWIAELSDIFSVYYQTISGADAEHVAMTYRSSVADAGTASLADALERNRHRDEAVGHTTVGPHRDDIDMTIDTLPMRRAASQGQCKTFVIAMRLAQYDFLHKASGIKPLLLLDDIFDKLDASRVERIMEIVTRPDFGQIFITDTNRTHLDEIVGRSAGSDWKLWLVDSGQLHPMASSSSPQPS